jgi:hypothetical protein
MHCITTFSIDGYHLYGKKMIDSWIRFWPKDSKLTVYTENYNIEEIDPRIDSICLEKFCPKLVEFKSKSFSMIKKDSSRKEINKIYKTVKWCHKVYAIDHALSNFDDDFVIFLDGDTRTVKNIGNNFAKDLVKNSLFAVHFEHLKHGLHFETGLMAFNRQHSQFTMFLEKITSGYDNFDIYDMEKTWDGYWFSKLWSMYNLDVVNLSQGCSGVFCHPLVKNFIAHDIGTEKYTSAGFNEYLGRKI